MCGKAGGAGKSQGAGKASKAAEQQQKPDNAQEQIAAAIRKLMQNPEQMTQQLGQLAQRLGMSGNPGLASALKGMGQ